MAEKFRWRADQGITLNGSTVSNWIDSVSGLGIPQSVEANQPDFISDSNKGHPSVKGNGTSKSLETFSAASGLRHNTTNFPSGILHFHVVMKLNALSNLGRPFGFGFFTPGEWHLVLETVSNGIDSFFNKLGATARNQRLSAAEILTAGVLMTISGQYELGTNNHSIFLDGVNVVDSSPSTDNVADTGTDDGFAILAAPNGVSAVAGHSNSEIYDIRIFDEAQDAVALDNESRNFWDTPAIGNGIYPKASLPKAISPAIFSIYP